MKKVITLFLFCITTVATADSMTIVQDMNGNFTATALTFITAPTTIYNPVPQR